MERIDQLIKNGIKIIQSDQVFSFSLDAVLLADFAKVKSQANRHLVDLCAGNGAVGLFLSTKTKGYIDLVEIQPKLADLAQRSVHLNHLDDRVRVHVFNLKEAPQRLGSDRFDVVTCNPPYFVDQPASLKNPNPYLAIARHELKTNLNEVLASSSHLLKTKGHLYLVHRPDRLPEILQTCQHYRLAPKKLRFVHPKQGREANMVLLEAMKDGRDNGLKVLPPIYAYTQDNHYTKQVAAILHGDRRR